MDVKRLQIYLFRKYFAASTLVQTQKHETEQITDHVDNESSQNQKQYWP